MKINILDSEGKYLGDFIIGESGTILPDAWTSDLLGDGYYSAQYQGGVRQDSGEVSGGSWEETGSPPAIDYAALAEEEKSARISLATQRITVWQTKLLIGRTLPPEDMASLNAWLDYIDIIEDTDTATAPDITWPTMPD